MRQQYMQHGDAMVWLLMPLMNIREWQPRSNWFDGCTTTFVHGLLGLPATNMMMCNMGLGQ